MSIGFVFDSGALIALEKPASARRVNALMATLGTDGRLLMSAGSVAEAWRGGAGRQVPLSFLLRRKDVEIQEITQPVAKAIGVFLGAYPDADDLVDAHVVMLARSRRFPVVTSDPEDIHAIDPKLACITI